MLFRTFLSFLDPQLGPPKFHRASSESAAPRVLGRREMASQLATPSQLAFPIYRYAYKYTIIHIIHVCQALIVQISFLKHPKMAQIILCDSSPKMSSLCLKNISLIAIFHDTSNQKCPTSPLPSPENPASPGFSHLSRQSLQRNRQATSFPSKASKASLSLRR